MPFSFKHRNLMLTRKIFLSLIFSSIWSIAGHQKLLYATENAVPCPQEWEVTPIEQASPTKPKALIIYAHGMNNNSKIFLQLATELKDQLQLPGVLLTWQGHEQSPNERTIPPDYAKAWVNNLEAIVCQVKKRFPDTPLIYVGYSLGASVAMKYLAEQKQRQRVFDKLVFLAPALAFQSKANLLRLSSILPASFPIPSLGEVDYRAHPTLPAQMYKDFFSLKDEVTAAPFSVHAPLLLVLEPRDELIHPNDSKILLAKYFEKIQILEIDNSQSELKKRYHHLFVDERSMGTLEWKKFKAELVKFLSDYIKQPAHPL